MYAMAHSNIAIKVVSGGIRLKNYHLWVLYATCAYCNVVRPNFVYQGMKMEWEI